MNVSQLVTCILLWRRNMNFNENIILDAFKIYSQLSLTGSCDLLDHDNYLVDDRVRNLVSLFAAEVNCTTIATGNQLLLVPLVMASPFHISNEQIKQKYLPKQALNADIYLMYFTVLCMYGMFFDSYNTTEPTRDFLTMSHWLEGINEQIEILSQHDDETISFMEKDMNYNWKTILKKWDAIDDTNEKVKKQDSRTKSRISFLNSIKQFLLEQELIEDLGELEIALTDKSKDIVSRYYMDSEYNRGILELLYGNKKEDE